MAAGRVCADFAARVSLIPFFRPPNVCRTALGWGERLQKKNFVEGLLETCQQLGHVRNMDYSNYQKSFLSHPRCLRNSFAALGLAVFCFWTCRPSKRPKTAGCIFGSFELTHMSRLSVHSCVPCSVRKSIFETSRLSVHRCSSVGSKYVIVNQFNRQQFAPVVELYHKVYRLPGFDCVRVSA